MCPQPLALRTAAWLGAESVRCRCESDTFATPGNKMKSRGDERRRKSRAAQDPDFVRERSLHSYSAAAVRRLSPPNPEKRRSFPTADRDAPRPRQAAL